MPGQDKSNAAVTKKERWANKEAKSLGVEEIKQSDEQCSSGQDRWKVFLLLYEMLQEFGTHLVEAAWAHLVSSFLHVSLIKLFTARYVNCLRYLI